VSGSHIDRLAQGADLVKRQCVQIHVKMDDGAEIEFGPGDVGVIAPGHDAWVVGNEPVVVIDITGLVNYAKQS